MTELFLKILFALPVYQSIVLSITLLISNRSKSGYSRIILGFFQLLMAFYFTFNFLYSIRLYTWLAYVYYLIVPVILMFVPIFYMYILSVTSPGFKFSRKHLLHFIPSFSYFFLNLPFLIASKSEKLQFITHGYSMNSPNNLYRYLLAIYAIGLLGVFTFQLIIYSAKAFKHYKKHKAYIESRYSFTENINLDWLLSLIICFAIFFIFNDILYLIGFRQNSIIQISYIVSMLATTYYIGYRGMKQMDIEDEDKNNQIVIIPNNNSTNLSEINNSTNNLDIDDIIIDNEYNKSKEKNENIKKYSGSTLSELQKNILLNKLINLMEYDKYFINSNLSVEDVANKLSTNSKYISQIINETYNKNFYNFINIYRIEEAKKLLTSDVNDIYSILGIAQSVGFLSKSSFNNSFKKYTGLTPTEYKTSMQNNA